MTIHRRGRWSVEDFSQHDEIHRAFDEAQQKANELNRPVEINPCTYIAEPNERPVVEVFEGIAASSGLWAPAEGFPSNNLIITSFPHHYSMNTSVLAAAGERLSGDASSTYLPTGAFDGTPAMRFYLDTTTGNTYSCIGSIGGVYDNVSTTQAVMGIRFMVKHSSGWCSQTDNQQKLLIMLPVAQSDGETVVSGDRPVILQKGVPSSDTAWVSCASTSCNCQSEDGQGYPFSNEAYDLKVHEEEWACVEMIADLNGTYKVWITSADNGINNSNYNPYVTLAWTDLSASQTMNAIDVVGSYCNAAVTDAYYEISHITIHESSTPIGPPSGFPS